MVTEGVQTGEDILRFRIPSLPSSMNAIYQIIFHLRQVQMKPEVRAWKHQAKMMIPIWKLPQNCETGFIRIKMEFHSHLWYYKNGKLKRVDAHNLQKVLIDAISEKMGFDDSMVFEWHGRKVIDTSEFVDVTMEFMKEDEAVKVPYLPEAV